MVRLLPITVLTAAVIFLAVYGAGIYLWTVCVVLLALIGAHLLEQQQYAASPEKPSSPKASRLTCRLLYGALVLYMLLMLIPLPLVLTPLTGALRHDQNRIAANVLTAAASLDTDVPRLMWFSITRNRAGTLRALLLMATLFTSWSVARRFSIPQRRGWLRFLITTGSLVGILGHLGKWVFPQGDTLWWIIPVPHALPGPVGGFINPNHFAGFIAILAPVALATAVDDARERRWWMLFLDLMAFSLITLVVLFSMSRGGVMAYSGGVGILLLLFFMRGSLKSKITLGLVTTAILGSALFFALQHAPVRKRLLSLRNPATTASLTTRVHAWRDTLNIWRHYPLLGAGPNAFRTVFPQYRTTSSRAARDFAENEYVQVIGETGVIGTILMLLFIGLLGSKIRTALRQDQPTAIAAVGAIAAVATHALVDFPLHLPLYAITVSTLAAGLWHPAQTAARPSARFIIHTPAVFVAILVLSLGSACRFDAPGFISGATTPQLTRALVWAPTSPLIWRRWSASLFEHGSKQHRHLAEHCLTQAATYDPNNYPLWRRLGQVRQELGDNRGANKAYRRVEALRDWIKLPVLPEEE